MKAARNAWALLLSLCLAGALVPTVAFAEACGAVGSPGLAASSSFSGEGSGTKEDPYVVRTAAQMDEVRNDLSACYELGCDIDLSGYDSWVPIGDEDAAFTGSFDGCGHTITGLTITEGDGLR